MTTTPRFGWCGPLQNAASMKEAGLDYIEAQLVPMQLEDDAAFADAKAGVGDLPLPALAFSYLFPHDARIVGPEKDERRNRAYFDRVVELMTIARAQIVVLGSGWTRNIPDGWSQRQAEDEFLKTLSWCADALRGTGATLVIEPLNRKESNLVNSVGDGARLAKLLGRDEVRGLADFYHMDEENEPLNELRAHSEWLAHIHLADTGRLNPGTGMYDYPTFFGNLKACGYGGLLSAECGFKGEPLASMRESAAFMRRAWNDA
ncbi:sugar phosphate isomerase/epimerase family protein [Burkholderia latens]|uniref:TIM barrel protein n=1 Tax=Burkholderia latens TaxID=488446 RepID=A0A6H9T4Y2_9BURK|nr:sugar phosphate isomerase/epimerase family protein [Burkholderia latens]KAB0634777.1 TIM barrel protein [Burkholderia latens]VWB08409.1 xylose isomerase domain-containing protein [Burkholderia latens]